jgi:transcriptional regulator with XRE-family HTH domain
MPDKKPWRFIGQRIRLLRKTNQLTIRQLANGCGMSSNAISLVERGEVAPTVATLCKIAHALGITIATFFDEACPGEDQTICDPFDEEPSPVGCTVSDPDNPASTYQNAGPTLPFQYGPAQRLPAILCVCGQIEYSDGDRSHRILPGETMIVDHARPHSLRNTGKETGIALLMLPSSLDRASWTNEL